jgi:flagellar biosynthesis/type III secretory pathway protein FliH
VTGEETRKRAAKIVFGDNPLKWAAWVNDWIANDLTTAPWLFKEERAAMAQIACQIEVAYNEGREAGYESGYDDGYSEGYNERDADS